MKPPVVIIGSGLAGYTVAREFRKLDKSSSLLIITGDDGGFYSKPMLSNAFAQGKHAASLVSQSADQMAEQLGAIILTHTQVLDIRHADKLVVTSSGEFEFQQLVLAVGAQAIRLPIKGDAADQVLSVNNLKDYALLREKMQQTGTTAHVTILGAGLIGCEFADDLTSGGHTVTLVDPNATPLAALAPASISQGLHNALENKRIDLKLGTTASSIDTDQQRLRVSLANGEHIVTDVVLSAVGLRPDIRLANNAQLRTDRGILVDQNGQTSAGGIFALGDCAQYTLADGSQCTLPYVAPLMSAARAIARSLCGELTPIDIKPTPVLVKTPSYPIALIPPAVGTANSGNWRTEQIGGTTISRFYDAGNKLRGFAVAPQEAKTRTALLGELNNASTENLSIAN